jgi:hypothetical protein
MNPDFPLIRNRQQSARSRQLKQKGFMRMAES